MTCLLKTRIWKDEANHRSVVVPIAGERRMPGISTGVQSAPAGSPRNGRTVLPPEDSIARSLDIVRHL
jgi:hypothetical protein